MGGNIGGRLLRLEAARRRDRHAPPGRRWDFGALSLEQQFELDQLLAAEAPLPHEPQRPLTPAEQRRLEELMARVVRVG